MLNQLQKRRIAKGYSYTYAVAAGLGTYLKIYLLPLLLTIILFTFLEQLSPKILLYLTLNITVASMVIFNAHMRNVAHHFHPGEFAVFSAINLPCQLMIGLAWLNDHSLVIPVSLQFTVIMLSNAILTDWQAYRYLRNGSSGSDIGPLAYHLNRRADYENVARRRLGIERVELLDTAQIARSDQQVVVAGLLPPLLFNTTVAPYGLSPQSNMENHSRHQAIEV